MKGFTAMSGTAGALLLVLAGAVQAAPRNACARAVGRPEPKRIELESALPDCAAAARARPRDAAVRYRHGRALYLLERDSEALAELRRAADLGSGAALRQLGLMQRWGYGMEADPAEAARLYQRALDRGDIEAAVDLGDSLGAGAGVNKDAVRAAALYRRASEAGVARGDLALGYAYETGAGVKQDLAAAVALYRKAADKGNAQAQYNLGILHHEGRGARRDQAEALRWFRRSAEAGSTDAMFALALAYQKGDGVPVDLSAAERWLLKGVAAGDAVAAPNSLAYLYASQGRELEKAATLAESALKAAPENPAVLDTVTLVRLRRGQAAEALAPAEQSVKLAPTPTHYTRLGDVLASVGRKAEARDAWKRALALVDAGANDPETNAAALRARLAAD